VFPDDSEKLHFFLVGKAVALGAQTVDEKVVYTAGYLKIHQFAHHLIIDGALFVERCDQLCEQSFYIMLCHMNLLVQNGPLKSGPYGS
jgi:hypothetical protein